MADAQFREVIVIDGEDRSAGPIDSAARRLAGLTRQIGAAGRMVASPVVSIVDRATAPLRAIRNSLGDVAKTAAGFVLGQALYDLPGYLMSAAQGAAEDAASVTQLQTAVENSGASWADYSDQLNAVITDGQRKAFSDDEQRASLSLLIAQTGSASEAQKRLGLAMDLSRGANIDLQTASKLLGKVTDDNVNVLSRYGIKVRQGASETELFGAIQQKFGGQAEKFAQSSAGQMQALTIQMGELQEQVGYLVLPAFTRLVSWANGTMVPFLSNKLIPAIGSAAEGLGRRLAPAAIVARATFKAFTTDAGALGIVVDQIRATFGDRAGDLFDPLLSGLMRVIPDLQDMGAAIMTALTGNWSLADRWYIVSNTFLNILTDWSESVDFGAVGARLADRLAASLTAALAGVDWSAAGQTVAAGVGSAAEAANPAPLKAAADAHATAYVDAFAGKIAGSKPITLPGMDKSVSFAGLGGEIEHAQRPLGQFGVLFAGLVPTLLIAAHVLPGVIAGVSGLAAVVGGAAAAFSAGAVALGAFLLPILLIAAAIAGLYVIWTNDVGGIQELTAAAFGGMIDLVGQLPALFDSVMATVVPALQAAAAWLTQVGTAIATYLAPYVAQLGPPLAELGANLQELGAAILPSLQAAFAALGPFIQSVAAVLTDLAITAWPAVRAALEAAGPLILQGIVESFKVLIAVANVIIDILKVAIPLALDAAKGAIQGATLIVQALHVAFDTGKTRIQGWIDQFAAAKRQVDDLVTSIQHVIDVVSNLPTGALDTVRSAAGSLGITLPGAAAADGAIVSKPTLVLAGEGGEPEVIAPLSRLRRAAADAGYGGGGTGGDVHVHVPTGVVRLDGAAGGSPEELAEKLAPPLARILAREIGRARLSAGVVGA